MNLNFIKKLKNTASNFLKNNFKNHSFKSYSQEGEDMILRRIFEGQAVGFYVDVGAHHPKRFSNTYWFYKRGWHGINIDAMPNSMDAFRRIRPRDINVETPIARTKKILKFFIFNEPALNSFSKEYAESLDGFGTYKLEYTKDLETSTLEEILDQYLPDNQKIDFLSIDVEGLDFEVLQSMNIKRFMPRVILIEILGSSISNIEEDNIYQHLQGDYYLYAKSVNTVFFKSKYF